MTRFNGVAIKNTHKTKLKVKKTKIARRNERRKWRNISKNIQNEAMADVSDFHIKSTEGEMLFCSKGMFFAMFDCVKTLLGESWRREIFWKPKQSPKQLSMPW